MNTVRENITHAADWLDDKLVPLLGPATLGPYGPDASTDPAPGEADTLCPVCHHAMSRHDRDVDAHSGHVFLCCPDSEAALETARHG